MTRAKHSSYTCVGVPVLEKKTEEEEEEAQIVFIGSTKLGPNLILPNVLYVPSFCINLLSVSKITELMNFLITFFSIFPFYRILTTKKMIGLWKQHNGFYYETM